MQIVPVKFIPESFSRAAWLPGILIWHYKERREGERRVSSMRRASISSLIYHERLFKDLIYRIQFNVSPLTPERLQVNDESFKAINPESSVGQALPMRHKRLYHFNSAFGRPTNLSLSN
jgi:hypothetical protein